jgi:Holliday junction resolvasome RuvABC endonuclease subunit
MSCKNILALDVATKTGWRTKTSSGTWDLTPRRDESSGMRIIRFKAKLREICELEGINVVCFERPGGIHKSSIMIQSELHGVMKLFCEENKIDYIAFSSKEVKKYATGNGNAGKPLMIQEAEKRKGSSVVDDNEADAYLIYDYYMSLYEI